MNRLTLGSLFDGSGGFPLGGLLAGITPVWASEVEPFPIRVTTKRLPFMRHYGDISSMDGSKIEPVDIITFGSPCQDMSIAGKRDGLGGNRSSLFYEAIRIVKEMRQKTNGKYPRYIVWENVPGSFSSNKGEDFRRVLEEICKIKDEGLSVPECKKWTAAGEIVGDAFSLAWRVLDAQYWGVPQRRKRIFLVADFASGSAGKILFESEGLSRYSASGFSAWQAAAATAESGVGAAGIGFDGYNSVITNDKSSTLGANCGMSTGRNGIILNDQGGERMDFSEDVTCTLRAEAHHPPCVIESAGFCTEHSAKSRGIGFEDETSPTLRAGTVAATVMYENHSQDTRYTGPLKTAPTVSSTYGTGGNNQPFVVNETPKTMKIRSGCEGGGKGALVQNDMSATLSTSNDQTVFVPFSKGTRPHSSKEAATWENGEVANTLNTFDVGESRCNELAVQTYGICSKDSNAMKSDNPNSGFYEAETSRTLDANGGNPSCNQGGMAVVAIQGSMIGRKDKNGPQGSGINEGVSFTLNATDKHAVSYGIDRATYNMGRNAKFNITVAEEIEPTLVAKGPGAVAQPADSSTYCMTTGDYTQVVNEKSPTLMARDYKDPPLVSTLGKPHGFYPQMKAESVNFTEDKSTTLVNGTNPGYQNGVMESTYIVRRLTPTECARLQGFPDWWCDDLETAEPSMDDLRYWYEVFETHRKVISKTSKPKTLKQISKWLKSPRSDTSEYKMWGNGVALPCVFFVLAGIAYYYEND